MSDTAEALEARAARLVQREVNVCLSSLVATLAKGYPEMHDGAAGELPGLCEQAFELSSPVPDYEEAAIQAGWSMSPDRRGWTRLLKYGEESIPGDIAADTAELACETDNLEPYGREVYEHWSVSQWLGDKLRENGEKVDDDFAGMVVWARTTTGQLISADSVIKRITAELHAS